MKLLTKETCRRDDMSHAPTPWRSVPCLTAPTLSEVFDSVGTHVGEHSNADAARIVACVNACDRAGLSNRALELLAAGDFAGFMKVGREEAGR